MIAVIADDFTGAAELAGISLRYGLKAEVCLNHIIKKEADVIIVCTNSRSMTNGDALSATAEVIKNILKLNPSILYKKIDSVLRGHVIDEVKLQMQIMKKNKAMILPANPSLKRTISNGEYHIDGKKITESDFVNDPEFPVTSSFISKMISNEDVTIKSHEDKLPENGMVIGEITTVEDLDKWAAVIDNSWMLAGAGDFFAALLKRNYKQEKQPEINLQSPFLYVCGTAFEESKQYISRLNNEQGCVSYLPEIVTDEWLNKTVGIIEDQNKVIIAIDESPSDALSLRMAMANVVKKIVQQKNIKEIYIEGGSTSAAVLAELNIKTLQPVNELSRGVVRMKADDLLITVKPGSYQLPEAIKRLFTI